MVDTPPAGPFYLTLVDESDTTFDASRHNQMEWWAFSHTLTLQEGEKPRLELEIENPRYGLLSLANKYAWFAYDKSPNKDGSQITPQFFGRLVGIPSDLQDEVITVQFITWPKDWIYRLQRVAEGLKQPPHYDKIWIDIGHRDDPMTIFEAFNSMVHTDPVTLEVTAEDIINASDGNVDITEDDHFYNSLKVSPGATPKSAIHVDATVKWTQTGRGYVDLGGFNFQSFSGDGILGDWPKPGANLAPGLTAFISQAWDNANVDSAVTTSWSSQYTNKEKTHSDGDTLSQSVSQSRPQFAGSSDLGFQLNYKYQPGFLDPFAVDGDGDRSPTNIPMSYESNSVWAGSYSIGTQLTAHYDIQRPHVERVVFTLFADVQSTTVDPQVGDDSETIVLSSVDVGIPLLDMLNWTTVAGTTVAPGTLIFPNDPQVPGGQTAQYTVDGGVAGVVPPEFSDVPGEETIDGTVTWISIGAASPPENAPDWAGAAHVNAGTIICPRRPIFLTRAAVVAAGERQFPPVPTPISAGTYLSDGTPGGTKVCTIGGDIGAGFETATIVPSGLPSGTAFFIARNSGQTGSQYVIPNFDETPNAVTVDNEVTWVCINIGEIPIGGIPGNVNGWTYFGSDRGRNVSLPYLFMRARARLRYTNRCVAVKFLLSYERGMDLSLRKTVTLHDRRLPNGLIAGKVTQLQYIANGGEFTCAVTMMSCVGNDTVIEAVAGEPEYIDDDYIDDDYYEHPGEVLLVGDNSDVGFTPVQPTPDDDGISFPLTKDKFVVFSGVKSIGNQGVAVLAAFNNMKNSQVAAMETWDVASLRQAALLNANGLGAQLKKTPKWVEYEFKPLSTKTFRVYHPKGTVLGLPKQIDLSGIATGD